MIHRATPFNTKAIEALIRAQHPRSKYATRCNISDSALRTAVSSLISQQQHHGPQGTYAAVAIHDGKVTGFMGGMLSRVYMIFDKLVAQDAFLINDGDPRDTFALIDGYLAWAKENRRVIEINLSWTDTLPGAERIGDLYGRKGFSKIGEIYEMRVEPVAEGIAA